MTTAGPAPWGLRRMRPFPATEVLPAATAVLDPVSQTVRWLGSDGREMPADARHKRSETSKETTTRTSLDGNPDQGTDQDGDTD